MTSRPNIHYFIHTKSDLFCFIYRFKISAIIIRPSIDLKQKEPNAHKKGS